MKQLLQKLIESQALQDSAGIARGMYRVADGLLKNHNELRNNDVLLKQTKVISSNINDQQISNQQQQKSKITPSDNISKPNEINQVEIEKQNQLAKKQQEEMIQQQLKFQEEQERQLHYQKQQQKREKEVKAKQAEEERKQVEEDSKLAYKQQKINQNESIQTQHATSNKEEINIQKGQDKISKEELNQKVKESINDIEEKPILKNDNVQFKNSPTNEDEEYVHNQKFSVGNEKAVPASSVSRAWGFGSLGIQLAYGAAKELIRTSIGGKEKVGGAGLKGLLLSEENADVLSQGLCKMRGAPLKLAQALSIQEDEVIPKHVRDAFEKARQSADIMPKKQLYKMLEQEIGENWKDHFESFEEVPFAAASIEIKTYILQSIIGQVHRGILKDGTKVAIKVQYPGVKESIDSDLNNLRRLMIYTGVFPKQMFLDRLIDYSRKELHEECNYTIEAEKQMKMYNYLKDDQDYKIPKIIESLSSERIMTSELIEGDTIDYISQNYPQELKDNIGMRLMKLTLKELFLFQTMQTDPNPSNFYFNRKTNKLNLIDFGGVHSYSHEFMDKYIDVIYSATINDRKRVLDISEELGYLTGEENQTMKTAHVDSVITVGEPFATEGKYDFGSQTLTTRTYKLMPQMLKNRLCPPPQETYSIHRKLSGAFLLSMKLQANYDCRSLFVPLYEDYKNKRQGITRKFL